MAITYNIVRRMTDQSKAIVDITLDANYAAGGYALTPSAMGMIQTNPATTPDMVDPQVITGQGFTPQWNQGTNKLQMFKTGAGLSGALAECVNTDLSSAVKVRCEVTGTPMA
jgi:hypothetical protein